MNSNKIMLLATLTLVVSIALYSVIPYSKDLITKKLARPPEIIKAREVLLKRSEQGIEIVKGLIDTAITNGGRSLFHSFSLAKAEEYRNNGLAFFIFENENLRFWSENFDIASIPELSGNLVKVQNTWSISYWVAKEHYKGLLLVSIKHDFPYENQFLKNQFHPSLSFLDGYRVNNYPREGSFPVFLFGTNPVFFLSYIPQNLDKLIENQESLLAWTSFFLLLTSLYLFFWLPYLRRNGLISFIILSLTIVALRLASLHWHFLPHGEWKLFTYDVFAYSWAIPSLGDMLLNALILFSLAVYAQRNIEIDSLIKGKLCEVKLFLLATLCFLALFMLDILFTILVSNSTITLEFYQIFNLSIFSIIGYLSIGIWIATILFLLNITYKALGSFTRYKRFLILGLSVTSSFFLTWVAADLPSLYGILLALLIIVIFVIRINRERLITPNIFILLVLFFSLFSVMVVTIQADIKDRSIRKILAINLSNERDPIAEVMFASLAKRLNSDSEVIDYLDNIAENEVNLYNYLKDNYLSGYFKKYDFQFTVCLPTSNLLIEKTGEVTGCYAFFEGMLNEYGMRIPGTSFFHLNNQNGRISYLGIIEFLLPDGTDICLYLEIDTKLSRELLGYPELLLEGNLKGRSALSNYSSAKYFNNQLIAHTGRYSYPYIWHSPPDSVGLYSFFDENGYNHMAYQGEGNVTIVISKSKASLFNITASFAWVFLFFGVTLLVLLNLGGLSISLNIRRYSFKNRIKQAMVLLLSFSLIMVALVTITYSVKNFERKNHENLSERLLSVIVSMEESISYEDVTESSMLGYLTSYLIQLSNIFQADINLYNLKGEMVASSRPEVFERRLMGTLINPVAWNEMVYNHKSKVIHTEQVGEMNYLSAYAPLLNGKNETIAFLNLPYFTRQSEFMREVYAIVVALVNLYALLILFTLLVAVFISNQISRPLELIREKLAKIDLTKHNETISYQGKDEVGQLVSEYNRMVAELAESASKLAQSQKQLAWREMAKQIAHEIKNPLTPIKLNLQLLVKAKKEGQANWEKMFDSFSQMLIEQINVLNRIATEFSNFAKMPVGNFSEVDLQSILNTVISLFSGYPTITIRLYNQSPTPLIVYADGEQLQRAFVNLIKNSVQALEGKTEGLIEVAVEKEGIWAKVSVIDNGSGVPESIRGKLFSPNFTTKSGGMGLGLAITKGIVEAHGGKIWFDSLIDTGSKFSIELPLIEMENYSG